MKRLAIACFALIFAVALPVLSFAQYDGVPGVSVVMNSRCSGPAVVLEISFTVYDEIPADIVGWRVDRTVLGECVDRDYVTDLRPWPEMGSTYIETNVLPMFPNRDEIYNIWGITDTGAEVFIYWPQRHNFAHADCLPGPSTVGYIVLQGDYPVFEPCPENCWWGVSFWDTYIEPELAVYADTGTLINLYGEYRAGMEGPYLRDMTWSLSSEECATVPVEEPSWDAVKAFYR